MNTAAVDPFSRFKSVQRDAWAQFAPMEAVTIIPAAILVKFAEVSAGQKVLDVGCGTGVVAVTAARRGAKVYGLDLAPVLLERAHENADLAEVDIEFVEGDIEALPYGDASFDVVLSQFGHMFAPRPEVAVQEMLRVLKPGGRIAFSTWPSELFVGRQLQVLMRCAPAPPTRRCAARLAGGLGDPKIVRERMGDLVTDLMFERGTAIAPTLSPKHTRALHESTIGLLGNIVQSLQDQPEQLAQVRAEYEELIAEAFEDNHLHQHFLMSRATKKV